MALGGGTLGGGTLGSSTSGSSGSSPAPSLLLLALIARQMRT